MRLLGNFGDIWPGFRSLPDKARDIPWNPVSRATRSVSFRFALYCAAVHAQRRNILFKSNCYLIGCLLGCFILVRVVCAAICRKNRSFRYFHGTLASKRSILLSSEIMQSRIRNIYRFRSVFAHVSILYSLFSFQTKIPGVRALYWKRQKIRASYLFLRRCMDSILTGSVQLAHPILITR